KQEGRVAGEERGSVVPKHQLKTHLRGGHRVSQFRGKVRRRKETVTALLDAVCSGRPEAAAWSTLETLAREEYPAEVEVLLPSWLADRLARVAEKRRPAVITAVAETLAAAPSGPRMAILLARATPTAGQPLAFQLALEAARHLPVPVAPDVLATVELCLADKALPRDVRLRGAAQLLLSTGPAGTRATGLLRFLVANTGKARAIERLREL